jgi:hypothetical protein
VERRLRIRLAAAPAPCGFIEWSGQMKLAMYDAGRSSPFLSAAKARDSASSMRTRCAARNFTYPSCFCCVDSPESRSWFERHELRNLSLRFRNGANRVHEGVFAVRCCQSDLALIDSWNCLEEFDHAVKLRLKVFDAIHPVDFGL